MLKNANIGDKFITRSLEIVVLCDIEEDETVICQGSRLRRYIVNGCEYSGDKSQDIIAKGSTVFYRFGEIPENEISNIYRGDVCVGQENGVSVYEAHKDLKGNFTPAIPAPLSEHTVDTLYGFLMYFNGPKYLVTGDLVGYGSDNEPLIKNVTTLRKID